MSFLQGQPLDVVGGGDFLARETTFIENFDAVWDDDNLRMAGNGVEAALEDDWAKNFQAYEKATGQRLQSEDEFMLRHTFLNKARELEGNPNADMTDMDRTMMARLEAADAKLAAYQAEHPEDTTVQNFTQMWEALRERSKEFRSAAADIGQRAGTSGVIGGFTAGIISSVNPVTNFWNFATLGIGGFGKGAIKRIAMEAGAGGVIETINQFTGVAERQELLGVPTTLAQKAAQIGLAATGAGVLRGAVEGTPALARAAERQFAPRRALGRELKKAVDKGQFVKDEMADVNRAFDDATLSFDPDAAPSSAGRAAAVAEQNAVLFGRMNPFDDTPAGVEAHSGKFLDTAEPVLLNLREQLLGTTALHRPVGVRFKEADFDATETVQRTIAEANKDPIVIEHAREQNPQVINEFEKLNKEITTKRRWYDDLGGRAKDERIARRLVAAEEEILVLEKQLAGKSAKGRKTLQNKIDAQRELMEAERTKLRGEETPDMKRIREEIEVVDLKLRDMAPKVSALFKHSREALGATKPVTKPKIAPNLRSVVSGLSERGDIDPQFPIRSAMDVINPRKINGRRVEEVTDNLVDDLAEIDPKVTELHEAETRSIADTVDEEAGTVDLGRGLENTDLDMVIHLDDATDGQTATLRQLLEENRLDDEMASVLTSCATGAVT